MNRKKIIEILLSTTKYTPEQKDIIMQLEEAKLEWESSKEYFQVVDDPKLVDYAIYREDQSRARYIYFLLEARRKDVTIDTSYMIEDLDAINK
ncbi:DUF2508 family protein [Clostridium estertheticum]|uniref:DUF2508 family protein n=1 Tax=Clostridium estertheticum TaxID=238834 RepID=UPI001C6EF753|nr:DUF2508 family protein [Clostridium estertheticum]MBW9154337.1 YaaL family protein [Clostridium estertheticum]MCB2356858.1 YaaL family protein [Clostridium estertheticum]WAG41222.1 YaaL family protein [Clostridium estertheticum]WLC84037.1 YaaL family protein [Clostridium estertheticum]